MTTRILWNKRDDDIDEVVFEHVACVHIEQMGDRCWWIGIDLDGGGYWAGNFTADSRGRMQFTQQEMDEFAWDRDETHEAEDPATMENSMITGATPKDGE